MSEEIILGIDLGTTFSAVAFINQHGKPEIIPPREQSDTRITPSVIFFDEEGTPIVGEAARNQELTQPDRTVTYIKREMGNPSYRFNVDGKDYFPEDLSALILKKLKNDAEAFFAKEICKAVISVPAYFKDDQREKTKTAGQIAGLDVIRIINEPTAAALAYGLDKVQGDQTILVYDFGGGTFDVTIMTAKDKEFKIISTDGDAKLGGYDIDALLVKYFAEQFQREYAIDLQAEIHTHLDLWEKAKEIKEALSFRSTVSVHLQSGEQQLRVDLDVEFFNELIEDKIQQTEKCMNRVIQDSNMNWEQIDIILLAGGSSRIPAVRDMIKRVTGKEVTRDMNPDECVAMGAAIQANIISREIGEPAPILEGGTDLVVYDVASHSLGVKALSSDKKKYINSIIIPRFTPIPCEKTRTYATNVDNQPSVEIEVLQGENDDPNSPEVQLIGKAGLKNLPFHKAGDLVIEVTLQYNADGVIEVVAKELKSGEMIREIIMQKTGTLSSEIIKEKQETISLFDV